MNRNSGGCQCGAVRYHFSGSLGRASICHCRMCQKAFGSFGAPLVSVPAANLTWTRGTPGIFRSSGPVARGFCRECGTPLFMQDDGDPNIELAIGTLDDPNAVTLESQVGVESKVTWFDSMPGLPAETTDQNNPAARDLYHTRQHPDHDTEHWP